MTKDHTKTLVFTTLGILQLKKMMIVKIFQRSSIVFFINHYLKNHKYDGYQRDKKCASLQDQSVSVSGVNIPLEFNGQLAK